MASKSKLKQSLPDLEEARPGFPAAEKFRHRSKSSPECEASSGRSAQMEMRREGVMQVEPASWALETTTCEGTVIKNAKCYFCRLHFDFTRPPLSDESQ